MKKWIDRTFIAAILFLLLIGLGRTVLFPIDVNGYENRYAVQLENPSFTGYADEKVQSNMENALNDQIPFSQFGKKLYHYANSVLLYQIYERSSIENRYIAFDQQFTFNQNIVYRPLYLSEIEPALNEKISGYNRIVEEYPDTEFYLYYIEKDTDCNFETGEKLGAFDYIKDGLVIQEDHIGCFRTDSFDEFSNDFYRTDHHWNCRGSYRAYCELLSLLGCSDEPVVRSDEVTLTSFKGSKATAVLSVWNEACFAYRYDFPMYSYRINGEQAEDYGAQKAYLDGLCSDPISYSSFYGDDNGEIIIDSGRGDRENILILGESYDNALLKLIAAHFHKTSSVDLRYYANDMGETFSLKDYIAENDIDKVLLIGNIDYFTLSEFLPED